MKWMLISLTAVVALPITASAGVQDEDTYGFHPVTPRVAAAKRLPRQEIKPFYWDRATPVHAPAFGDPRRTPLLRTRDLPSEAMPGF